MLRAFALGAAAATSLAAFPLSALAADGAPAVAAAAATAAAAVPAAAAAAATPATPAVKPPAPAPNAPIASGPNGVVVTAEDVKAESQKVPEAARNSFLGKVDGVSAVVQNLYTRRQLAAEAVQEHLDQQPEIAAALQIARDRVLSDARVAELDKSAVPTEAALEKYAHAVYEAHPERFTQPAQVRVAHILVRNTEADAKAKAQKLLAELKAGADFQKLAQDQSGDPGSAARGGELGFIKPGQMVPEFEKAAFALKKPGDLSPLVESKFGYHIIKLEETKPARKEPFDEVKAPLMAEARTKAQQDARAEKARQLLEKAKIDDATLEAFSAQYR